MKEISRGWQNVVYDLGNGRVLKKRSSFMAQFVFIYKERIKKGETPSPLEVFRNTKKVTSRNKEANRYIKKLLTKINPTFLGNPIFINQTDYEQDKVLVMKEALASSSVAQAKLFLEKYVELIHITWRYGFIDMTHNFLANSGVDKNGNVILLDFGELLFNKEEVAKRIRNKLWLKTTSTRKFPEGEIKDFYRKIMAEKITLENLDKFWRESI